MQKIRVGIVLGIFFSLQLTATDNPAYRNSITETRTCASILTVICDHTIHVQDLDNTIMKPLQMLGSDQWYGDLIKRFREEGSTQNQAIDKAIDMWTQVQRVTKMQPVEDFIPNMVSHFIQKLDHLRDVALTARPPIWQKSH